MDATQIGIEAAELTKEARFGKAIGNFLGGALDKGFKHGFTRQATNAAGQAGRKFSLGRTATVGAPGAFLGYKGLQDAGQGLSGGYKGTENLDWHRQRMQGSGHTGLRGMFNRAYSTVTNPFQSAAAVVGGHTGDNAPQNINGQLAPNLHRMNEDYQHAKTRMGELQSDYSSQDNAIQDQINALRTGGAYDGYPSVQAMRQGQQLQLQQARLMEQMNQGTFGQNWLQRNIGSGLGMERGIGYHRNAVNNFGPQIESALASNDTPVDDAAWQSYVNSQSAQPTQGNDAADYGFLADMNRYLQ